MILLGKSKYILIALLIITVFAALYINSSNESDAQNFVESGSPGAFVYNSGGVLLTDCGCTPYAEVLDFNYKFYQAHDTSTDYLLLIIAGDKQKEFQIDGKPYTTYRFTLNGEDVFSLDIRLDLDSDNESIIFATYSLPDYIYSKDEADTGVFKSWVNLSRDGTYITRIFFSGGQYDDVPIKNYADKTITPLVVQNADKTGSHPFLNAKPGETTHFTIESELYKSTLNYSLIYLLNYEQIFIGENVSSASTNFRRVFASVDFKVPDVSCDSTLNILAIPHIDFDVRTYTGGLEDPTNLSDTVDMRARASLRMGIIP